MSTQLHRLVLLHGPPGTGKTSLSLGLAQKLSIHRRDIYPRTKLIQVDSTMLWSHFVGESAKNISTAFKDLLRICSSEPASLLVVVFDEIESLVTVREGSIRRNEVHDTVKACDAFLTALDMLLGTPNILIVCTSNLATSLDPAFLSRCGNNRFYLGGGSLHVRYEIFKDSINSLICSGRVVSRGQIRDFSISETLKYDNDAPSTVLRRTILRLGNIDSRILRQYPESVLALKLEPYQDSLPLSTFMAHIEQSVTGFLENKPENSGERVTNKRKTFAEDINTHGASLDNDTADRLLPSAKVKRSTSMTSVRAQEERPEVR